MSSHEDAKMTRTRCGALKWRSQTRKILQSQITSSAPEALEISLPPLHLLSRLTSPSPGAARRLLDEMGQWDALVDAALARLEARSLLRATRPIALAAPTAAPRTFDGPGPWDHAAVEIRLDRDTLHQWLAEGQCQEKLPLCSTC